MKVQTLYFSTQEFFLTVKDLIRRLPSGGGADSYSKFSEGDRKLNKKFMDMQKDIHAALCGEYQCPLSSPLNNYFPTLPLFLFLFCSDSIDTPLAMRLLRELVSSSNIYLSSQSPNVRLLIAIATYITDIMEVFGVIPGRASIGFPLSDQSESSTEVRAQWQCHTYSVCRINQSSLGVPTLS